MSKRSDHWNDGQSNVKIFYESTAVGQGTIRLIDATHAFVRVRNFPLGADTFLELVVCAESGKSQRIPVRVLENTDEGLEVGFERIIASGIYSPLG